MSVYDAVTLEDDVFCGPSMVFTNVYNPRAAVVRKNEYRRTLVRQGATLGANSTLVCGIAVGLRHARKDLGCVVETIIDQMVEADVVITWQSDCPRRAIAAP